MKENRKQKLSGIMALFLVLAMLIGGTLAWQDISQHKTNTFRTTSVQHNVVLVEDFIPVANWKKNEVKTKEVSVRNGQKTDSEDFTYDDAYIRLQFLEYMAVGEQKYDESDQRLMVDENGDFYRFETIVDAEAFMNDPDNGISYDATQQATRIVKYKSLFGTKGAVSEADKEKEYYYIATEAGDKNGQYGKFLVTGEDVTDFESITGKGNFEPNTTPAYHQLNQKDKSKFSVHTWDKDATNYTEESEFTKYVSWKLGVDVIAMEDWVAAGKPQVAKWILDTSSPQGWTYWGEPLKHHSEDSVKFQTSKILESVKLDKMPDGQADYMIHVNMDAVSLNDINLWTDAPDQVIDGITGSDRYELSRAELLKSITRGNGLNPTGSFTEATQLIAELASAQAVYDDADATRQEINDAKVALDAKIAAYELQVAKNELQAVIDIANTKVEADYTSATFAALTSAKTDATTALIKADVTIAELNAAKANLTTAIEGLVDKPVPPATKGDKITFANKQWTVVAEHEGMSLVLADQLTKAEMTAMGITDADSNGYVKYVKSGSTYVPYSQSRLKDVDEAFYNKYIATNANVVSSVQKVSFNDEVGNAAWNTRNDHPTRLDANGTKKAFSLSVSDINEYNIAQVDRGTDYFENWLRSPGDSSSTSAFISYSGVLAGNAAVYGNNAVCPALWVDLSTLDFSR